MTYYRIPATWLTYGYVTVEAPSLQEALQKAHDSPDLPDDGDYIDDSFEIDREGVELNYGTCHVCGCEVSLGGWDDADGPIEGRRISETQTVICSGCAETESSSV